MASRKIRKKNHIVVNYIVLSLFCPKAAQWLPWVNGVTLDESRSCICYHITKYRYTGIKSRYAKEETGNEGRDCGVNVRETVKIRTKKFWIILLWNVAVLIYVEERLAEDNFVAMVLVTMSPGHCLFTRCLAVLFWFKCYEQFISFCLNLLLYFSGDIQPSLRTVLLDSTIWYGSTKPLFWALPTSMTSKLWSVSREG